MRQYNEQLTNRIREALADLPHVEEKVMFSGVSFLVNDKMCINVSRDELMCRVGRKEAEKCVEQNGCRQMMMRGKPMKDFVMVGEEGFRTQKELDHWISLCLAFNNQAKASPKKKKKTD
ncbi:TfoX/Sxy family protein [Mucilaginibacter sp. AW1-3]